MQKTSLGIFQSVILNDLGIVHGFSTKQFGDMRNPKKRKLFLSALGLADSSLVEEEQIHRDNIHVVSSSDREKIIQGVDGLVYKQSPDDQGVVLSVHTADCVPLGMVDFKTKIIGVAHAGWKGTCLHIGQKVIEQMKTLGASVEDIRVVVGPRICGMCYDVDEKRADVFRAEFMEMHSDVVKKHGGKFFVDIGKANYIDLLMVGVKPEHIDYDPHLCTFERDEFFSFRRSGKPLPGETMGVIGFRK